MASMAITAMDISTADTAGITTIMRFTTGAAAGRANGDGHPWAGAQAAASEAVVTAAAVAVGAIDNQPKS